MPRGTTSLCVCLFDVILIVMKWTLVQVIGINFAGTNFAYLLVLSKVFRFNFYVASASKSLCFFTNVQLFGSAKFKKLK